MFVLHLEEDLAFVEPMGGGEHEGEGHGGGEPVVGRRGSGDEAFADGAEEAEAGEEVEGDGIGADSEEW
jgi:hypothetical protein